MVSFCNRMLINYEHEFNVHESPRLDCKSSFFYWILMFSCFYNLLISAWAQQCTVARSGIIFAIFLSELSSPDTSEDFRTTSWPQLYLLPYCSPQEKFKHIIDRISSVSLKMPWHWLFHIQKFLLLEEADWFLAKTPQGGKKLWQTGSSAEIYLHFLYPLYQGLHCSDGRKMKLILTWYSH